MMQVGDWVEGDNGYGVIVKLFPKYYQYWDSIPAEKKAGDKEQDDVVIKRFCSFDFKVYPQTQLNSMKYISKVSKKEMETINKLLKDEKKAKRYEKYKTEEISEICNWNLKIAVTKIKTIHAALEQLENNGNLNMTTKEIETYLKKTFGITNLFENPKNANCYIQLVSVGLGIYKNKELLFKKIGIIEIDND